MDPPRGAPGHRRRASRRRVLASRARGGYCFHLNGALGELLQTLGYDVVRHVGGVHGPDGASEHEMTNHLVLTVHGLPNAQNPEGVWYVDAGLGDAVYEPIPLVSGTYEQPPFRLTIERSPSGVGDWHLVHDPAGSFAGMEWRATPAAMDEFAQRHTWFTTSADSWFAKVLIVQRRDATGVDILRGLSLQRVGAGAYQSTITTSGELFEVLADHFALDLGAVDERARAALWDRVHATHETWAAEAPPE